MRRGGLLCTILGMLLLGLPALAQEQGWGHVKGRIVLGKGKPPRTLDPASFVQGQVPERLQFINPRTMGLRWTYVWLIQSESRSEEPLPIHPRLKKVDGSEAELVLANGFIDPLCLALRQGQELVVRNKSQASETFKLVGRMDGKLIAESAMILPDKEWRIKDVPVEPEQLFVMGGEPQRGAMVRVFAHPYFAVADDRGDFEIKHAPTGEYQLVFWHVLAGYRGEGNRPPTLPITIEADGAVDLGDIPWK